MQNRSINQDPKTLLNPILARLSLSSAYQRRRGAEDHSRITVDGQRPNRMAEYPCILLSTPVCARGQGASRRTMDETAGLPRPARLRTPHSPLRLVYGSHMEERQTLRLP